MKIRSLTIVFLFFAAANLSFGQIKKPAKWAFKASKENPKVGDIITIFFTATIEEGWYLYSSKLAVEGPMPTSVSFTANGSFQAIGELQAINPKEKQDEVWGGKIQYFVKTGVFTQKVKILKDHPVIDGKLSYQTCTIKDGSCIPNKDKFTLSL